MLVSLFSFKSGNIWRYLGNIVRPYHYLINELFIAGFSPCVSKVVALRFNNEFVDSVCGGELCGVLLDCTCFYAEQGGQLYDTGFMIKQDDEVCM